MIDEATTRRNVGDKTSTLKKQEGWKCEEIIAEVMESVLSSYGEGSKKKRGVKNEIEKYMK